MRPIVLALLALLVVAGPAVADVIHLKNGGKLEGEILSEEGGVVKVKTAFGEVTVERAKIESIERKATPRQEYEKRLGELAADDAEGHYQLALFCREHGMRKQEGELYAKTLEIDDQHPGANEAVGNVEYEGEWMTPAEAERRKAAAEDEEMRERGLVRYKDRWVTPEEKENLEKGLVFHDGKWMTPDEVKEAEGYVKYKGRWVKREELDRIRLTELYSDWMQIDVNVVISKRFVVAGPYEEEELSQVLDGAEQIYEQFLDIFGMDDDGVLFEGAEEDAGRGRLHIVYAKKALDYVHVLDAMAKKYPQDLPESRVDLMRSQKGFYFVYPACYIIGYQFPNPFEQVRASVMHKLSHVLLMRYKYRAGFFPWWLIEGLGTYQEISALGHCDTYCISEGGYARQEPEAKQKWAGMSRWKELAKMQVIGLSDRSLLKLSKSTLNELDFRDLAKCWSLCEWWIGRHREEFVKFVDLLKAGTEFPEAIQRAFKKPHQLIDKEWRDYVRANY